MRMRWTCVSGVADISIARGDLLTWLVAVATETTSTQATFVMGNVRVRRVEMWGGATNAVSDVTTNTINFRWAGGQYGIDKEIMAFGTRENPAYISTTPPSKSLAGEWSSISNASGSTDAIMRFIQLPVSSIVDIEFEYTLADYSAYTSESQTEITLASALPSGIYATSIDSSENADFSPYGWIQATVSSIPMKKKATAVASSPVTEVDELLATNAALVAALKSTKK